jgi:hypothetical protein
MTAAPGAGFSQGLSGRRTPAEASRAGSFFGMFIGSLAAAASGTRANP